MPKRKKILVYFLVIAASISIAWVGQASVSNGTGNPGKGPIVIEADELYFSDSTGDMHAKGNVVVSQDKSKLTGDLMRGNSKSGEVWIDDDAVYSAPGTKLVGTESRYNYKTRTGEISKAVGKVDREIVSGKTIELLPDEVIIHYGSTTGCPAKEPDYHVSADKVEIWPGDKMIAYNAKFWIKNTVIFSMPRYQKSLQKNAQSDFPRIGFTSQNGTFIGQRLEYPFSDKFSVYFDPVWYSKAGYKPSYGASYHPGLFTLGVVDGYFRDNDDYWIKKEPEFNLTAGHQLGSLPVDVSFKATYGKWIDSEKASWHQDYMIYFSGKPIYINNIFSLNLGMGFERVIESYDDSANNILRWDATLHEQWSDRLSTYVGYHYTRNNDTLFEYEQTDLARELDTGIRYKIDKMNSIGFVQSYDLNNNRVYDQDYFWYRDVHCWELILEYRAKRHEYVVNFTTKRF